MGKKKENCYYEKGTNRIQSEDKVDTCRGDCIANFVSWLMIFLSLYFLNISGFAQT